MKHKQGGSLMCVVPQLHAHLSGSISRQCLHEIWLKKKAQEPGFSIEDPWVTMPPGKVDYSLQTWVVPPLSYMHSKHFPPTFNIQIFSILQQINLQSSQ